MAVPVTVLVSLIVTVFLGWVALFVVGVISVCMTLFVCPDASACFGALAIS